MNETQYIFNREEKREGKWNNAMWQNDDLFC